MTTNSAAEPSPCDDVANSLCDDAGKDKDYRLWRIFPISPDNPNTILVHGAVMLGQVREHPNHYFYRLGHLLHEELNHNVWEFEYADECVPITREVCFNYGDLTKYGERLVEAIGIVKEKSQKPDGTVGLVNIIAHSMGGLVARYATQKQDVTVDKIITLDTGHFGFEGEWAENLVKQLPDELQNSALCAEQTAPGSEFIYTLAKDFSQGKFKLLSLAANPRVLPIIVSLTSSSLVKVCPNGSVIYDQENTKFSILEGYDHLTIALILHDKHPAFVQIKSFLCDSAYQPVSPLAEKPLYFTVVLNEKPTSEYPKLLSMRDTPLGARVDINEKSGYYSVVFTVGSDVDTQAVKIQLAPDKEARGILTKGQSTIWWSEATCNH
jgi:pimeloyl-ACP methyl ester carboxylesterase